MLVFCHVNSSKFSTAGWLRNLFFLKNRFYNSFTGYCFFGKRLCLSFTGIFNFLNATRLSPSFKFTNFTP